MDTVPKPKRGQRSWTDAQRAEQARKLRERKIWLKSTGPKTAEGKATSSYNATKHGCYGTEFKQICQWLRLQRLYLQTVVFMDKYDLFEDEKSEENTFQISGNELIDQCANLPSKSSPLKGEDLGGDENLNICTHVHTPILTFPPRGGRNKSKINAYDKSAHESFSSLAPRVIVGLDLLIDSSYRVDLHSTFPHRKNLYTLSLQPITLGRRPLQL